MGYKPNLFTGPLIVGISYEAARYGLSYAGSAYVQSKLTQGYQFYISSKMFFGWCERNFSKLDNKNLNKILYFYLPVYVFQIHLSSTDPKHLH